MHLHAASPAHPPTATPAPPARRRGMLLALLAGAALAAGEPTAAPGATAGPIRTDWPCYSGPDGRWRDRSGVKLAADMSAAKPVWDSEERRVGYGKTSTGGTPKSFGTLAPGGFASPIVAGGLVLLAYFSPSGTVVDEADFAKAGKDEALRQRYLVEADDVVIAIDGATGRTRWKRAFPGGMSLPMGKRGGWGITPAAGKGRVFAIGTTGRVRALDLASGEPAWEATVGPAHEQLMAARAQAIARKTAAEASAAAQLIVVGDVLVAPDLREGLIGFDTATGKQLWHATGALTSGWNMPVPIRIDGADHVAVVNRNGTLRALKVASGAVAWTEELKSLHLGNLAASDRHLLVYVPAPGSDPAAPAPVGVLAAYTYDARGVARAWSLDDVPVDLKKDSGPRRKPLVDADGTIYLIRYQNLADTRHRELVLVREGDGKVLHRQPDFNDEILNLWGDRLITVSDTSHRPRAANAEIWRMWTRDPAAFRPLGGGWHVNGPQPLHTATGGYEVPLIDVFADGFLFCRTVEGIRCYDLR